jgi:signal transduction histidine kinase
MGALAAVIAAAAGAGAAWALSRARYDGLRRAEASRERLKLEALVQNIPDGLVLTDLRGDVLSMNAPAREILGEPKSADIRMRIQDILKGRTQSETLELKRAGAGAGSGFFKTHVALFQTPGGEDLGVMVLLRDMTSERSVDALKEEFFQSVAHDLRAPLFAMQGYLRLLEKSMHPDEHQKGYLDAITKSCEKLTLFIQDTLDSARIEAGQMKLSLAPVDAKAVIERAVGLFRPLAEEKGIRLEADVPAAAPKSVEADERLLERVFYNLLSNALKFTPRGGRISVELSEAGPDQAEFSVSDTGPGVPRPQRAQIFEKFRQADGAGRMGFGLGLSICAKIVKLHGGTIWVESEPGLGSDFVFRLPLKQPAKALE